MIKLDPGEKAVIEALQGGGAEIRGGTTEPPPPPPGSIADGVSVTQYGAKGDGETDDTDAIQRALDAGAGTRVLFPHRGPWKTTRKVLIKGNCYVQGYGGACLHWYGDGGMGVSESVGPLQYLRVEGFEINNRSGNHTALGFGLNELNDVNYGGGPSIQIDVAVVLYNKLIRSKVLLNNGTQGRTWFNNNLVESRDLGLWPYVLMFSAPGSHNPASNDATDNGLWCCENTIRAVCARPENSDFGTDSDLIKITNGISRVHLHGNKIVNLAPDTVEAQIDMFTGGGRMMITENDISNVNLHYKQTGGHGGMQNIDAYAGLSVRGNNLDWSTSHSGWFHCPGFIRCSGFIDVSHNFLTISATGRQVTGFIFDNSHDNSDSGLGSASPRSCTVIGNRVWLKGRNDHRFMEVQPPTGTGPAAFYAINANVVSAPSGQNTATAAVSAAHRSTITGNISPESPPWTGGAGSKVEANIFKT